MSGSRLTTLDASFLELESSLQDRAGRSDDYAEGVRAFTSRTAAKFQGR